MFTIAIDVSIKLRKFNFVKIELVDKAITVWH